MRLITRPITPPLSLLLAALTLCACVEQDPPGLLPIVQYEAPVNCYVDQEVIFDASASYDPDGEVVAWSFDFGDGSPALRGEEPVVSYAWSRPGIYWTSITVIDARGNKATELREIVVSRPEDADYLRCQSDRPFCPPYYSCNPQSFRCALDLIPCDDAQNTCPDDLRCDQGACEAP